MGNVDKFVQAWLSFSDNYDRVSNRISEEAYLKGATFGFDIQKARKVVTELSFEATDEQLEVIRLAMLAIEVIVNDHNDGNLEKPSFYEVSLEDDVEVDEAEGQRTSSDEDTAIFNWFDIRDLTLMYSQTMEQANAPLSVVDLTNGKVAYVNNTVTLNTPEEIEHLKYDIDVEIANYPLVMAFDDSNNVITRKADLPDGIGKYVTRKAKGWMFENEVWGCTLYKIC